MQKHYAPLKKVVESIRYGEAIHYDIGKIEDEERKRIIKTIRKIANHNLISVHIRWTNNKETVIITESL